jgi:hypothetical protein
MTVTESIYVHDKIRTDQIREILITIQSRFHVLCSNAKITG